MRQSAYLQTSAQTVPPLQVMGTSWGAEVTDTGQLWGGVYCAFICKVLTGLPKCLGFTPNVHPEPWL